MWIPKKIIQVCIEYMYLESIFAGYKCLLNSFKEAFRKKKLIE